MKDAQLFVLDTQGSLVAVRANPEGALLSAIDSFDVTLDTDLDTLNGTAIAVNSGIANNGTLRVVQVTDVATSVFVTGASGTIMAVGDIAADVADTESAPIKVGGVARSANPAAVAAGDRVSATFDLVGRQVTYPYQVRGLVATAQAATSTLAEVTLLAGAASTFHDLVEITCANNTGVAVRLSLRDATAAGVVKTFDIPANNTIQQTFPAPVPQNAAADTWTIQNAGAGDISTTDITVSALFIKNV